MMKFYKNDVLHYDDVVIVPQHSTIKSRKEIDCSTKLGNLTLSVPVLSANMDTVTGKEMCVEMFKLGGLGVMHRFMSVEENIMDYEFVKTAGAECFISVGVTRDSKERLEALYEIGARYVCIDIAHGDHILMHDMIKWIREKYQDTVYIMAGNVGTASGAKNLEHWGANAVKVGLSNGCFAAGTRILMANGVYKNIESIAPGEKVINKRGKPVVVKNSFSTGRKKVIKYRTNSFYKETVCTPDHQHWIGDLSSVSKNTILGAGYKNLLSKESKTIPKQSKIKWMDIENTINSNSCLLTPTNVEFELPQTFNILLHKRFGGNWRTGYKKELSSQLKPSYDLGYVFGTFLGDGNTHLTINKKSKSKSGNVNWTFDIDEKDIAIKLSNSIQSLFGKQTTINTPKNKNVIKVTLYDKPFAEWIACFGKKTQKHLPENLLVDNNDYLRGLYDGLIDSDGSVTKHNINTFANTSTSLIELYNVLHWKLFKSIPLNEQKPVTTGNLKNCNIENCNTSYSVTEYKSINKRIIGNEQIIKILDHSSNLEEMEVFDLEVDCDTHSFIANNVIVHNSVCITKNVTGISTPMITAIAECAAAVNIPVVGDGGLRTSGDIAKALGAGADVVMCGGMFAGCDETPPVVRIKHNDNDFLLRQDQVPYRGNASAETMKKFRPSDDMPTPEGKQIYVDRKGPTSGQINYIRDGVKSSMSYSNSRTLEEFRAKVMFSVKKH